jgi:hypothetical protein
VAHSLVLAGDRRGGHGGENNHRRVNYMELREQGWVIGSGMIESGGKQFKMSFAGPGMRWSRAGAERLLPIRAAILGDQFDQRWETIYISSVFRNCLHLNSIVPTTTSSYLECVFLFVKNQNLSGVN